MRRDFHLKNNIMAKKIYKTAVIGCGNIGAEVGNYNKAVQPGTHAGAYKLNKKTKLSALVDVDADRLEKVGKCFPGVPLYADAEKMYKEIKPDIVSIATPTKYHYDNVMLAARHGVPIILCEKPISDEINKAKKMIAACKKSGSKLFINHMRHFDPLLLKWADRVRGGYIGDAYQGNAFYYNGLYNNGTHLLDILRIFLGEPDWVLARYNKKTSSNSNDLNVDGLIVFKSGAVVSLQSLSRNYGFFGFRIFGETGMVNARNLCFEVEYRKKIDNKNYKGFYELAQKIKKEGVPRSYIKSVIDYLVSCADEKKEVISSGEDGLAVLRILTALKKSADKNGKEIKL
jgi:predicted dehydrogenase